MPEKTTPNHLSLTTTEFLLKLGERPGLIHNLTTKHGELTFDSPGYNIREQAANFQPRMIPVGVPEQRLIVRLRSDSP